jgi:quercetin dioxygenase-like cupin family protein
MRLVIAGFAPGRTGGHHVSRGFHPGGALGRHFHPGPELIYVLEGALLLEQDGHPPVTLKAGDTVHLPSHPQSANASTTAQAKALVFLVGEKGQPIITLVQ